MTNHGGVSADGFHSRVLGEAEGEHYNPKIQSRTATPLSQFSFESQIVTTDDPEPEAEKELDSDDRAAVWAVDVTMQKAGHWNLRAEDVQLHLQFNFRRGLIELRLRPAEGEVASAFRIEAGRDNPLTAPLPNLTPGERVRVSFDVRTGYFVGAAQPEAELNRSATPGLHPIQAWVTYRLVPVLPDRGVTALSHLDLPIASD